MGKEEVEVEKKHLKETKSEEDYIEMTINEFLNLFASSFYF